jgi:hypothetical protein
MNGDGVFTRGNIAAGELIGMYAGRVVQQSDEYVAEVWNSDGLAINVDGKPRDDVEGSIVGNINEFVWDYEANNCRMEVGGLIIANRKIDSGAELLMSYDPEFGKHYDWDCSKQTLLRQLPAWIESAKQILGLPERCDARQTGWSEVSEVVNRLSTADIGEVRRRARDSAWEALVVAWVDGAMRGLGQVHLVQPSSTEGGWWRWLERLLRCENFYNQTAFREHGRPCSLSLISTMYPSQQVTGGVVECPRL